MKHNDFDLLTDPIPRLLRRLAVPVGTVCLQHHVQRGGHLLWGLISTQALRPSPGLSGLLLIIAVGAGISMGSAALLGHSLGAGRREEAELTPPGPLLPASVHGLLLAVAGSVPPHPLQLLRGDGE